MSGHWSLPHSLAADRPQELWLPECLYCLSCKRPWTPEAAGWITRIYYYLPPLSFHNLLATSSVNLPVKVPFHFCSNLCLAHFMADRAYMVCCHCGSIVAGSSGPFAKQNLGVLDGDRQWWCWHCLGQTYPIPERVRQWVATQPTAVVAQADWSWLRV